MADDASSLVLEHLRAIRADVLEMKEMLRQDGHRLTRIETSIALLRRKRATAQKISD